ncbi:hypothetical protein C8R46DRAFT_1235602 [Mycena filopes]|nr:hypothetical protein C8R46DRAFT_1235602 [Mycena filopes]
MGSRVALPSSSPPSSTLTRRPLRTALIESPPTRRLIRSCHPRLLLLLISLLLCPRLRPRAALHRTIPILIPVYSNTREGAARIASRTPLFRPFSPTGLAPARPPYSLLGNLPVLSVQAAILARATVPQDGYEKHFDPNR